MESDGDERATDAVEKEALPINILFGGDGLGDCADAIGINVGAKGKLYKDAAYGIIVVETFHDGDDLLDGGSFGEGDMLESDADLLGGFSLHADIDSGVWTFPSLDDSELGLEAGELLLEGSDLVRDRLTDGPGDRVSVARWGRKKRYFATRVPSMTRAWEEDMVMAREKERRAD